MNIFIFVKHGAVETTVDNVKEIDLVNNKVLIKDTSICDYMFYKSDYHFAYSDNYLGEVNRITFN